MAGRTWNLRFNLDEFNAAFSGLDGSEKAEFMDGLSRGVNAGRCRDDASEAWQGGFTLGESMRSEADEFQQRKSSAGQRSAEVRREKDGTAQPPRTPPEQTPNTPRTPIEQTSNQSTIHNPLTTNHNPQTEPTPSPSRKRERKPPDTSAGMDLVSIVWRLHPDRTRDGKTLAIGARLPTRDKLMGKVKQYGLTAEDITEIQNVYLTHPNVANGFVQATEVFWGDNGRWFDCWQVVQDKRRKAAERGENAEVA